MSEHCAYGDQAGGLIDLQRAARQVDRLEAADRLHWAMVSKMTGNEESHLSRCADFAESNWDKMCMDEKQAVKVVVVMDARTRVAVEDSCFAQRVRMYLRTRELSLVDCFETASLRLNVP